MSLGLNELTIDLQNSMNAVEQQSPLIGSGNGLEPNREQTMVRTNDDPI